MFLIIYPAFLLSFLPYMCLIVFLSPPLGSIYSILFISKTLPWACLQYVWVACTTTMQPEFMFVAIFIFRLISWTLQILFFLHVYVCPPLLFLFTFVVCVSATTSGLHNSSYSSRIWSSWYLNFVDRFPFSVVSSVNATSRAAIANAKFMKVYSI